MADTTKIKEHMEVVGSDGQHVGIVDHVLGEQIKLTKSDPASGGTHHVIPTSWVAEVAQSVKLSKSSEEAKQQWQSA